MKIHISFLFRTICTFLIVFISVTGMVRIFGNKLKSHYLDIAEMQSEKVASLVTFNTVSSLLENSYSQVSFIYDDDDVLFNTGEINSLLKESVNEIYKELKKVEAGTSSYFVSEYGNGIIYEVPFYLFSDNVILSMIGPKIPVRFSLLGDVKGNVKSSIEEFGINNALITINLVIDFSSRVFVPLSSNIVDTSLEIPLYSKIITGEIPSFYPGLIQGVNYVYSSEVQL